MRRLTALLTFVVVSVLGIVGCGGGTGSFGGGGGLNIFLADAPLTDVSAVNITIDRIEAHLDGEWIEIESDPQTIDLLTLTQNEALIGSANVPSGTYTQIRLFISEATVTDENGTHDVAVPSAAQTGIKLNVNAVVGGETVGILLDFNVEKSLILQGNGKYRLKPVIPVELTKQCGSVSGFAYYEGQAMKGVHVLATYTDGDSYEIGTIVNTSTTMEDGSFKIWALKEGVYTIDLFLETGQLIRFSATIDDVVVTAEHCIDLGAINLVYGIGSYLPSPGGG